MIEVKNGCLRNYPWVDFCVSWVQLKMDSAFMISECLFWEMGSQQGLFFNCIFEGLEMCSCTPCKPQLLQTGNVSAVAKGFWRSWKIFDLVHMIQFVSNCLYIARVLPCTAKTVCYFHCSNSCAKYCNRTSYIVGGSTFSWTTVSLLTHFGYQAVLFSGLKIHTWTSIESNRQVLVKNGIKY
jgi:hypothetical protein